MADMERELTEIKARLHIDGWGNSGIL